MRITLPDDQWVDIKDYGPNVLTGEDEDIVRSAMVLTGEGADGKFTAAVSGSLRMEFAMLARVITGWSLPQPVNFANIRGLTRQQLKPLRAAIKPFMLELKDEDDDPNS